MKILVCIKQVPNVAAMKLNPETKTLVREGVPLEVSSFDVRALLKAVELCKAGGLPSEAHPAGAKEGEAVALTMGPPQAAKALEQCLALGANRAIHLCDRAFAGADTLATARALAAAIKAEKPDLVFCGRYSTDSETGQVGPEVAEILDLPQATGVRSIAINGTTATVERETDEGFETVELPLPCLITAAEDLAPERFPSKKDREAAKTKTITTLTAAQLAIDVATIGQAGSPTWVKDVVTTAAKRTCTFVATVDELVAALRRRNAFARPVVSVPTGVKRVRGTGPAVWVLAEGTKRVTLELIGKGAELAAALKGELTVVSLGHDVKRHAPLYASYGVDRVYVCDHAELAPYRTEPHAAVLTRAIRDRKPHILLAPSTSIGRDLLPRVAARLGLGLTGDAIDLRMDGTNLVADKPAFGGNVVAPILTKTTPQMATVRPGLLRPPVPDPARQAEIVELAFEGSSRTRVTASKPAGGNVDLDAAEVVVGVGMGIGGPESLPVIRELADALKAPLATTRDCTDKGWLPRQHQVGLTGKCIAPRLYFAIGIRGAFEHTVGIQKAGTIVAINNDDQAMIWDSADIGIKGDWKEIVPALAKAIRS